MSEGRRSGGASAFEGSGATLGGELSGSAHGGPWTVGVDVGGTFTDLVLVDGDGWVRAEAKVLTTIRPAEGVEEGVGRLLASGGVPAAEVGRVVHGTTLATNTLLERTGARTALVTTRGFRDILAMGKEQRYEVYDLRLPFPEPLVPRHLRFTVDERVTADGRVLRPVRRAQVDAVARRLADAAVEAVAVALLHSYRLPAHERQVGEWLAQRLPRVPVVLSSDVNPEVREYERTSTAVVSAYLAPRLGAYLEEMEVRLRRLGIAAPLWVMQSSGMLLPAQEARRQPASLLESGPAAGALAAAQWARSAGARLALGFDMGGTTAKACLVRDGRPRLTGAFEAARQQRLMPGSGIPVRVASVDLVEIGSGGGSLARVDEDGRLKVGPASAGAQPGPACYGQGGEDATFTDAALVDGRLARGGLLAGELRLDRGRARAALASCVGAPLGLDVESAAAAVVQVATERMAGALRVQATERGAEAADCLLVAFGGAAPTCVAEVARRLGVERVLVPPAAGVLSALGLAAAAVATEVARSWPVVLPEVDWPELGAVWQGMRRTAAQRLNAAESELRFSWRVDARFLGQFHEITLEVPEAFVVDRSVAALDWAFRQAYRQHFRHLPDVTRIQCLTWRLLAERQAERPVRPQPAGPAPRKVAETPDGVWELARDAVPAEDLEGPGRVFDPYTTVVVGRRDRVRRLEDGSLLLTVGGRGRGSRDAV